VTAIRAHGVAEAFGRRTVLAAVELELAELPRAEAQEAPATLLAAEIEVREVRPL
jgi:hypothetical protein